MITQTVLQNILVLFTDECKSLLGDKLYDVRLYGSYARGTQEEYSDIDVMVLLDTDDAEAKKYLLPVCGIVSEISLKFNGIVLTPFVCGKNYYNKMKNLPGFINNIVNEGVSVYAG